MADLRVDVLLSMQRAMLEQVTADLRGVAVAVVGTAESGVVAARFLYEGAVDALRADCASSAEAHCVADFTQGVSVSFSAVPDADRDLLSGEEWVYLRWEPESDV